MILLYPQVPPVRRIPPLLWLRLKHDLSSYLADRGADEAMVVTWYHRQFKEAANERYLSSEEERVGAYYIILPLLALPVNPRLTKVLKRI